MAGEGVLSAQKPIVINITAITTTPMVRSGTQDRRVFMGILNFLFSLEESPGLALGWPGYSQSSPGLVRSNFSTTTGHHTKVSKLIAEDNLKVKKN